MNPLLSPLDAVIGEIETHVDEAGWDQPPQLFALVPTEQLLHAEPSLARTMGLLAGDPSSLTPVAQEPLEPGRLDEQLAGLVFGADVLGVVLAHEVVVLPPEAEAGLASVTDEQQAARLAVEHPQRREVRMVVGVLRGGQQAAVLRLRSTTGESSSDERLTGPDLAPALAAALLATLEDAPA